MELKALISSLKYVLPLQELLSWTCGALGTVEASDAGVSSCSSS